MRIYDESEMGICRLLRTFDDSPHGEMSCARMSLSGVATASSDPLVSLWDYDTGKVDSQLDTGSSEVPFSFSPPVVCSGLCLLCLMYLVRMGCLLLRSSCSLICYLRLTG